MVHNVCFDFKKELMFRSEIINLLCLKRRRNSINAKEENVGFCIFIHAVRLISTSSQKIADCSYLWQSTSNALHTTSKKHDLSYKEHSLVFEYPYWTVGLVLLF
jgi:hypothetical protein